MGVDNGSSLLMTTLGLLLKHEELLTIAKVKFSKTFFFFRSSSPVGSNMVSLAKRSKMERGSRATFQNLWGEETRDRDQPSGVGFGLSHFRFLSSICSMRQVVVVVVVEIHPVVLVFCHKFMPRG